MTPLSSIYIGALRPAISLCKQLLAALEEPGVNHGARASRFLAADGLAVDAVRSSLRSSKRYQGGVDARISTRVAITCTANKDDHISNAPLLHDPWAGTSSDAAGADRIAAPEFVLSAFAHIVGVIAPLDTPERRAVEDPGSMIQKSRASIRSSGFRP